MSNSLDLTRLLPARYRDKTLDSLLKNAYNRHLSKEDTVPTFGFIGDTSALQPGEVGIVERDLERQLHQLTPLIYAEHATEKKLFSWPDLVQKLVLLGVDYSKIGETFTSGSYNFAPPIDLDKFCNYNEYVWVGGWVFIAPSLPWAALGIPPAASLVSVFTTASNSTYFPEYYVIERGDLNSSGDPVITAPTDWSAWSYTNLWVHREDAAAFLAAHPGVISQDQLVQASRPIIEYSRFLKLNSYQTIDGAPADSGSFGIPPKIRLNQLPLFDLYDHDGLHLGATSAIFYYSEGSEYPVDAVLNRRVATDENSDFIFEHSLVSSSGQLYFYKFLNGVNTELRTIWRQGPASAPRYVKYDETGTLLNQDKFVNYRNYFWTVVDAPSQPVYNPLGLPQYYVLESGGTSGWSIDNHWVHVSQLPKSKLRSYVQAERPIIEFNGLLESELASSKTTFNQSPTFTHYRHDTATATYVAIPAGTTPEDLNLNDAYCQHHLLVRLSDLPDVEAAVLSTPEVLSACFEFAGETYLQGLSTGAFVPNLDGITYGYRAVIVSSPSSSRGTLTVTAVNSVCIPQVLTFRWVIAGTHFEVTGSVTGLLPPATVGSSYLTAGITVSLLAGSSPLLDGDTFTVEIKSYVHEKSQLYVKVDGSYRTVDTPESFMTERSGALVIDANLSQLNGVWEIPPQLEWNAQSETRATVKEGDLYFHFTDIIRSQPGIIGSETGKNNWRNLPSQNLGLGGTIKQHDGDVALLISLLLQEGVSSLTLIDFARESYEQLGSVAHTFVEQELPVLLTSGRFQLPLSGDSVDPALVSEFKSYFSGVSPVVTSSSTPTDDYLATPFYDSTMSILNLVVTLPYLGLVPRVLPRKELDLELGTNVLVHHDGHVRALPTTSADLLKKIVTREFERSSGLKTAGFITGSTFPDRPYQGQYWFKTSTAQLFYYRVISDTGEQPTTAINGDYSVDRAAGVLYQYNGTWNNVGTTQVALAAPWTEVNLGLIEQNLLLALETELYENCPTLSAPFNASLLEADPLYQSNLQRELENFGVTYGVADVYSATYSASNSLTWNYTSVIAAGASGPLAVWQSIYEDVYGTPRPDLQPWIPAGYASETALLVDLIGASLVPVGTSSWSTSFWNSCATFIRSRYVTQGLPPKLSVNVATGALLGPYGFGSAEQLVNTVPVSAADRFSFGDRGPVEIYWRKTRSYLYSQQRVYFKLNPLLYVRSTWGIKQLTVGEYTLNPSLGRKDSPVTTQLHGDSLGELPTSTWVGVTVLSPPLVPEIYTVTCVSRLSGIFKVTSTLSPSPVFFTGTSFSNAEISLVLSPSPRGFYWGDTFTIALEVNGSYTKSAQPALYLRAEGFNQLFVQYNRRYGQDLQVAINSSLFKNWTVKLGYRFGGLVNTDLLSFKNVDVIDESAYSVLLKENKWYNSSWIDGLRVQLVQRGSTERSGSLNVPTVGSGVTPGEDWVFRVDTFNSRRPQLTWQVLDTAELNPVTFIALDGKKTLFPWKKYSSTAALTTVSAPFLITGIQNVINFITGYSRWLESCGWRFNEPGTPIDPSTNRVLDYQLLAEKFIVQLYSGVDAGSTFTFNPFSRKVHYSTPRGTVSSLNDLLGIEQETVCTLLDSGGRRVLTSDVRVFRQDDVTELVSDVPLYALHLLTSEYEHVVLFENYSVDSLLIYDGFLGQKAKQMFVSGQKQASFTGRIDFGGHFLLGDQMKRNLESSVEGILKLYDTSSSRENLPETERARALLGFQKSNYFADRDTPDLTEFRFWQGMISNKGTNFAIDAFTNSAKYSSTNLDEYWAYKLAEYGDARAHNKPELKVEPEDSTTELTNYLFVEEDDLAALRGAEDSDGFDDPDYDLSPFDGLTVFNPGTFYESAFNPLGTHLVKPTDEQRWFRYVDLKAFQYFAAEEFIRFNLTPTSLEDFYQITDSRGIPVRADVFELIDTTLVGALLGGYDDSSYDELPYDYSSNNPIIYRETGDYILGTDPPEYSPPKFRRVNHSTIQILDVSILTRLLTVVGYRPAFGVYSPVRLYNYVSNTVVKDDVMWWDPARGSHHPEAIASVDYQLTNDPARYNNSILNTKNSNLEKQKVWGEAEVGKVWWNQKNLFWQPYSDTKLLPDLNDRLASWGAPSDLSTVEVYEWVRSSNPPSSYVGDGEPALDKLVKRTRTWWQRPVAWRYSTNPGLTPRLLAAYQPSQLKLSLASGRGTAVLKTGSFQALGLTKGYKLAGAKYYTSSQTDANLQTVFGTATITSSSPMFTVGSAAGFDDGPLWTSSPYFTFGIEVINETITFRDDNLGQYTLDNETDSTGKKFIKLTHVHSKVNQLLEIRDTLEKAGSQQAYYFDSLGIKVYLTAIYGHADTWPSLGVPAESVRKNVVATALGVLSHQIYVRSTVEVFSPAAFTYGTTTYTKLPDSSLDPAGLIGWVAWRDPDVNPTQGEEPPYNKYLPLAGSWVQVGGFLTDLADDISLRTADQWIWFDGASYVPYMFTWSNWSEVEPILRTVRFITSSVYSADQLFRDQFTFATLSNSEVLARVQVYVNEKLLPASRWTTGVSSDGFPYLIISGVNLGDTIKTREAVPPLSAEALAFDPDVKDDPFKIAHYKRETPYVLEARRDETANLTVKNYYFWVRDKQTIAKGKTVSIKQAARLLVQHDGLYSVPQVVKFYDQLDGRPNRYALLSLRGLGLYVRRQSSYKLRLSKNPALRDDDQELDLKNVHVEWKLLRPYSPVRLPRQLWDLLTDALVGQNQLNQSLPSSALELYDSRNLTEQRYGFGDGQIFVDPQVARATLKYTVLNTRVRKYDVNNVQTVDYISYPGFDVNFLDVYLSSPAEIRKFMSDLWRFASPKQINEIFFAVLEDAVAKNLELTDFFKTSFISLSEARSLEQA